MSNIDYQAKLEAYRRSLTQPPAEEPKVGVVVGGPVVPTLVCVRCGMERHRDNPGKSMRLCPECYDRQNGGATVNRMDEDAPGYRLAACVTDMRVAIEIATTAIRLGKYADALNALEHVKAPGRALERLHPTQRQELP